MTIEQEQRRIAALPRQQWPAEMAKLSGVAYDRVRNFLRGVAQVMDKGGVSRG